MISAAEMPGISCGDCGLPISLPLASVPSNPEEVLCPACQKQAKLRETLEFLIVPTIINEAGERVDADGEPEEGSWRLEAWREGREVGHAKFDVWEDGSGGYGNLLLLQISVAKDLQRQGIATAMLNELSSRYECAISVEDFTPDGYALFGGKYHW